MVLILTGFQCWNLWGFSCNGVDTCEVSAALFAGEIEQNDAAVVAALHKLEQREEDSVGILPYSTFQIH
jgi:hypothetical protein